LALLAYSAKTGKGPGIKVPEIAKQPAINLKSSISDKLLSDIPEAGDKVTAKDLVGLKSTSVLSSWAGGSYIQPESFARPEFEIPAGNTFHRISTVAEDSFSGVSGTYATSDLADYNRYVATFRQEKGTFHGTEMAALHHVTFNSTEPVKVPNLTTVLGTMKGVLADEVNSGNVIGPSKPPKVLASSISNTSAMSAYNALSGGGWSSSRSHALMDALHARGYGALVDEMDAGVIGDHPLVIFPSTAKSFTHKVAEPLTKEAIDAAESNLTEISNRKLTLFGAKTGITEAAKKSLGSPLPALDSAEQLAEAMAKA